MEGWKMLGTRSSVFHFGDVEVREREFSLVKAGQVVTVEPKAFRVLLFLLRNPQKLITKEELLNAVWGDVAVGDNALARSIALLRRLLGDDTHVPRYIETVATVGYRFVCKVEVSEDPLGQLDAIGEPNGLDEDESVAKRGEQNVWRDPRLRKRLLASAAVVVALGLAIAVWYLRLPLPLPRVTSYIQITHDGHKKGLAGTDGSRVYFYQVSPNFIAQVAVTGGEIAQIPVADSEHYLLYLHDVSPDGSNLLLIAEQEAGAFWALWNVRILGGTVRRMGAAANAAFSPDGNSIAYATQEGEIWIMRSDGTGSHKLVPAGYRVSGLAWSPDGSRIRFGRDSKLWEMLSTGANLHEFLPNWRPSSQKGKCCGRWTPDGRFYLFISRTSRAERSQIWALDERRDRLRRASTEPFQLTTGPLNWGTPIPGKDGKSIFSVGLTERGELYRYDALGKRFGTLLGGISAEYVAFSRDGKSVAYVTYPDGILWKANGDGSNPVQLTEPPLYPQNPRWSPDGSQIVFHDWGSQNLATSYIVSSEGGGPRRLLPDDNQQQADPSWSPDGNRIVFSAGEFRDRQKTHLSILDLANHKVTTVPGSTGKWSPRWSPDGRYIASLSWERPELKVFDFKTERWSTLSVSDDVNFPTWSQDSQYIYSLVISSGGQDVYRVRASGGKPERIVDLKDWHFAGWGLYSMTLDSTDALLLLRDVGSNDIYALPLEEK
jgi:Tol biopolymer transport system component/DNA-binding winged helix-turn-helix (wHTH) protein